MEAIRKNWGYVEGSCERSNKKEDLKSDELLRLRREILEQILSKWGVVFEATDSRS